MAAAEAALPDGWTAHADAEGRTYYHNAASGATTWEHPGGAAVAAQDAVAAAGDDGVMQGWESPLVKAVIKWFTDTEMEGLFRDAAAFADMHCDVFEPDQEVHKLEYTELHKQYLQLFEDKLSAFLNSLGGYTLEHFFAALPKCVKQDSEADMMAECMLCCLDYTFFCQLMCERKREKNAEIDLEAAVVSAARSQGATSPSRRPGLVSRLGRQRA
eukprot:CAMPEP_0176132830 /NCGR_PEP_ID=MMETSP0120_2-20121206/67306_1 /TAXON_ID=160619 /ORGANISM="Kryptoperidinium foliaceum, Strain CCMP 1326" /LENGTH=214 /DNA_ID=CAMNT_0017468345 /DNA_START=32 /DNA_END=674 /DNA_ORIENTATION=-